MKFKIHFRRRRDAGQPPHQRRIKLPPQAIYLTAVIALSLGISGSMLAVYRLIDRTLTASENVLRLRQEVSVATFRPEDFLTAVKLLEQKTAQSEPLEWSKVINPFQTRWPAAGGKPLGR